jgi:hypothetical protein
MSKVIKGESMKASNIKPIRHGEIMLVPVDKIPSGEVSKHSKFIVGHSETGHHHVLESETQFEVMTAGEKQDLYFRLFEPAKLVHKKQTDKHRDLVIPAGTYKRFHDTEYDPFERIIRDVAD